MRYAMISVVMLSCALLLGSEIETLHKRQPNNNLEHDKSRSHKEVDSKDHGITEIGLERTTCFGTCPAYTVFIKSNGDVRYWGDKYADRLGEHTGKVNTAAFNELAQFINDSGYMDLEDTYQRLVTDDSTAYTTVVKKGKRKVIKNYANAGPTKLWAIEELIDKLVLSTNWDADSKK